MSAPNIPLTGDALLVAVTNTMVAFHERYYHRAPAPRRSVSVRLPDRIPDMAVTVVGVGARRTIAVAAWATVGTTRAVWPRGVTT
jgi:hypothetical protein